MKFNKMNEVEVRTLATAAGEAKLMKYNHVCYIKINNPAERTIRERVMNFEKQLKLLNK